jgi:hypothetical protein
MLLRPRFPYIALALLVCSIASPVNSAPQFTIGETVTPTGLIWLRSAPLSSAPAIGSEPLGAQGVVINGPTTSGITTYFQVAFSDNLTGWIYQGVIAAASPSAPTLSFAASSAYVAAGASTTLSWSSTNATSCTGVGFSPSVTSGSVSVTPSLSTIYSITCTGSGGSSTRTASVVVNPFPAVSWKKSLPVTFGNPAIVPFGGTETRTLAFMDGSLYAGIGDWRDPQLENPQTPGAQVLRLDSPTGSWVEDQDFNQLIRNTTNKAYQAIDVLMPAHFDHDYANNPIQPVDVLVAGVWTLTSGMTIFEKTVPTGAVGGGGTWTSVNLVGGANPNGEVRSLASYTDSVTGVEMAFAGGAPYGIFSGAYNSTVGRIVWGANAEAGSDTLTSQGTTSSGTQIRVMSFAACGGKLYATIYDTIWVRTDGPNPSWHRFYAYTGALASESSGFRSLTCVRNLYGPGTMLIAVLENNSPDVYDFPLNGSPPTIELHGANYLGTHIGVGVGYGLGYSSVVYTQSGTTHCPDFLIGYYIAAPSYPSAYEGNYPYASFLIRHCNGTYDFQTIIDPSLSQSPPLLAARAMVVSRFASDPPGTIYAGGYGCSLSYSAHNTDWIYRGVPEQ